MASDPDRLLSSDPDLSTTDYDFTGGETDRPSLVSALEQRVDGDVRFDSYSRQLYATDASAYELTPIGVVLPRTTADVAAVVSYCADNGIPVLPRGGGTSLAGQAVNEAVVLDFTRYMDAVLDTDPDARTARAQAGCRLGDLNERLEPHGLKFAPDPAWADKSALGGAIGNNSTGAHSLKYGKTDAYIEECEVVLADGTVERFGDTSLEHLRAEADPEGSLLARIYAEVLRVIDEDAEAIRERYPELKRNVSGYNLDRLIAEANGRYGEEGMVNLARLLAGSEGTLAVVTEATVSLEPRPETKSVALLTYDSLADAMADVDPILEHDPAAVEVMDDVLLDLARDTAEFSDVVAALPDGTDSVLLVEFYAESDQAGRRKVTELLADRVRRETEDGPGTEASTLARAGLEAHDAEERARFWKMRKSGLPILLSRTSDAKHISFIEDCAVPAEHLPEYVERFQEILADNDTFASFYAHAGPGVLHVRPLIDTKTADGITAMRDIADRVTDLVVELGGSVSGEHGDGRARTAWNRKLYGDQLWQSFRSLKSAFDPDWLLNPGSVCGSHDLTDHLRFDPEYTFEAGFEPELAWDNDNGMQGMVELCHGCGGCRGGQSTTGGVMCPTFRAANEEIQSTRGRANALRGAMSGDLPADPTDEEFRTEVLDLCIGCKGCAHDCPSGVDLAKLKTEVTHAAHQENGADLRDRLFANVRLVNRVGSALAPLSNWLMGLPGAGMLMEESLGIARERELPSFARETFREWFNARDGLDVSAGNATRTAVIVPDVYTNYNHPATGKAAVRVLEAAGVRVELAAVEDVGRPAYSLGFIGKTREQAGRAVRHLDPAIRAGKDVVVLEPSDAVMLQSDLLDLGLDIGEDTGRDGRSAGTSPVERVAANTYGVMEYLDRFGLDDRLPLGEGTRQGPSGEETAADLVYHGHCHQKATKKDHHAVGVLRRVGYTVDPLDSTCCGMAGSFGYESEHYSMSRAIGELLFDQVEASSGDQVVAPGASCRGQFANDASYERPPHPIQKVAEAFTHPQ